jgi:hypothetical protein
MARYSHWHGGPFRPRFHERWHEPHDEPHDEPHHDPGFHLPFPLPPFFEMENEGEYPSGEEEAERQHHRRSRWARYQGGQGQDEFGDRGEEADGRRHRGRWVRHNGRVVLLGL